MLRRVFSYLRRHHLALIALFVALGGTAYAAAAYVQAPEGGSGRADFANKGFSPSDTEKKLIRLPGQGKVVVTCKSSPNDEMDIGFTNTSDAALTVWDNLGSVNRTSLSPDDSADLLTATAPVTVVGDVHIADFADGTSAVVHIAAIRALAGANCIVHAQYELLTK